jgi:hypothetical protein
MSSKATLRQAGRCAYPWVQGVKNTATLHPKQLKFQISANIHISGLHAIVDTSSTATETMTFAAALHRKWVLSRMMDCEPPPPATSDELRALVP